MNDNPTAAQRREIGNLRADQIHEAALEAREAIVRLSDALFSEVVGDHDTLIDVAYGIAYRGPAGKDGAPTPLIADDYGDWLLGVAADIRADLKQLTDAAGEVPSWFEPEKAA